MDSVPTNSSSIDIPAQIEAILFWKAEPVTKKKLATLLNIDIDTLRDNLALLEKNLQRSGLALVQTPGEVMLGTSREYSSLIEQLTKEELIRDLGKAGIETLSIILYQGPIARADIDYIRGVNSQFILRNLLIRGLIERVDNPKDFRSFLYKTTISLLSHLGISKTEELPEYVSVRAEIDLFRNVQNQLTEEDASIKINNENTLQENIS